MGWISRGLAASIAILLMGAAIPAYCADPPVRCLVLQIKWLDQRQRHDLRGAAATYIKIAKTCPELMANAFGRFTPFFVEELVGAKLRDVRFAVFATLYK